MVGTYCRRTDERILQVNQNLEANNDNQVKQKFEMDKLFA